MTTHNTDDRRVERRVAADGVRARMRLGHPLSVVDVSPRGALVEGACQLRPGARVDVHLETDTRRHMVAARVIRSAVVAIHPEAGVTYRSGLSFSESCDWVREAMTHGGYGLPEGSDAGPAHAGASLPATVAGERK
jgi:hypothetical protein